MSRQSISLAEFLSWTAGCVVAVAATASWAYSTFETKDALAIRRDLNNQRLERIESKIDLLIEQSMNRKGK